MAEGFRSEFQRQVIENPPECAEMDPDYWFADPLDEEERFGKSERAIAISVCDRCPFKHQCLQEALTNDIQHGVWGGLIPQQREAYRKRMDTSPSRWAYLTS